MYIKQLFLVFIFLQLNTGAFGQSSIENQLNIYFDDSINFEYKGSQKDDVGNIEYYFESIEETSYRYDVVYMLVMDPIYYDTDTEILNSLVDKYTVDNNYTKVNRGDKIIFESSEEKKLADDNRFWYVKSGIFVYKKRLYSVYVTSRERSVKSLYTKVINGINLK